MSAPELIAGVAAILGANSTVMTAFGDTWNQAAQTGVSKFFTDIADQVPVPYCVISELGEIYEYMTGTTVPIEQSSVNFLASGSHQFEIYGSGRQLTRTLGYDIALALNDAAFSVANTEVMYYRMAHMSFALPLPDLGGPAVPVIWRRIFVFSYQFNTLLSTGGN